MDSKLTPPKLQTISEDPFNAETPLSALMDEVTDSELVYVRNHFEAPEIQAASWALTVDGLVEESGSFSLSDLSNFPQKTLRVTLECAGNARKSMHPDPPGVSWGYGAVSVVEFTGTSLSNLLDTLQLRDEATEIAFYGADRGEVAPGRTESFVRSLPLETALDPETILAWEMNGEPLSRDHGFPLRLVLPGWYGMASVKWLDRISAIPEKFRGFFQDEHYLYQEEDGTPDGEPVGRIRVRSLVLGSTEQVAGEITIEGIAWSGEGEIRQVQVSLDGGSNWRPAELDPLNSRFDVQRWRLRWHPEKGDRFTVFSRATDSAGNVQPTSDRWNRLGYGNNGLHSYEFSIP